MRGSGDMILTMALIVILNKLCRSCSTGETRFADVASRTVLSGVVFEGKMLHRVDVSNPSKLSAVKFQVTRFLKGDLPKNASESVIVGTRIADGQLDCLENLRPKRRYIVFLSSTTEMVGAEVAAYKVSGPPEEYSGRAAKDVEAHSCRNCAQKPSVRLSPRKLSPAKTGANVSIKCVAKGRPFPMISWYKNDQPLFLLSSTNSEHLVIKSKKTNSVLLIRNLTSEDEAGYWCQAENVLASANSSTVSLVLRKGVEIGTGPPDDWKTTVKRIPCHEQNRKYCLNGGECYLLPDNHSKYCICAEGFTGPRCQDRGDELETSKIDVRASNTDKALVFVGLFLTFLVLFVLVAILYCVAKMRYEFSSRKQQMVNEITATNPFQPSYVNHKVQPTTTTTVHITEVEDAKSCNNTLARRPRLSAVSSAVEADSDFDRNFTKASREETGRHNKRMTSSRHSTSSSNQGLLLVDDDVVDGGAPGKCSSHLAPQHQPVHSALDDCSSTATSSDRDSSRPLSSRSKYENERLCAASRDRFDYSPRCRTAELATSDDLSKARKSWSDTRQPDASNKSTEEMNNLLKELGVYLPEDGSN